MAAASWSRFPVCAAVVFSVIATSNLATAAEAIFLPTVENSGRPSTPAPQGMAWIPGGEFSMGAEPLGTASGVMSQAIADARPIHRVYVDGFWMDQTEVTNDAFAVFVRATGYVTVAERVPRQEDFPDVSPQLLRAGSAVFASPPRRAANDSPLAWKYVPGANWRHPLGPQSGIEGKGRYPAVHIAYEDALAYARWADKRLPTEAEWEFAARGGLTGKLYPWGNDFRSSGRWMANTYQGRFPVDDVGADLFIGIGPVGRFPANGYGLHDVAGNVWEWTSDWYRPDYYVTLAAAAHTAVRNPQGPSSAFDPLDVSQKKRVQRGGSFLCTDQYCARYLVGARGKGEITTGTNHLGFRCVKDAR